MIIVDEITRLHDATARVLHTPTMPKYLRGFQHSRQCEAVTDEPAQRLMAKSWPGRSYVCFFSRLLRQGRVLRAITIIPGSHNPKSNYRFAPWSTPTSFGSSEGMASRRHHSRCLRRPCQSRSSTGIWIGYSCVAKHRITLLGWRSSYNPFR